MNLLKRSSPNTPRHSSARQPSSPPSDHYHPSQTATSTSTPGSLRYPSNFQDSIRGSPNTMAPQSSLQLLQMGGQNSAFKALIPNNSPRLGSHMNYESDNENLDSDEEIIVNDDSDDEEAHNQLRRAVMEMNHRLLMSANEEQGSENREGGGSPKGESDRKSACQPLQLTKHDR